MSNISKSASFFSHLCIEQCGGSCCDPWWGIISYTVIKEDGLFNLEDFKGEIIKGIKDREERIRNNYITNETPPRPLFSLPERYNAIVQNIKVDGSKLSVSMLAMFAYRCLFLSKDKTCLIHPSSLDGADIRPSHCGFMGSSDVRPGGKGYCRIIHAAQTNSGSGVRRAIETEKEASEKHYREGFETAEAAAEAVINRLKEYCSKYAKHLLVEDRQVFLGRNDPCYCGSNKKYKKCHGQ